MNRRFLLIILGTANGIDKDLNFIADGETGVNYVDGKGMFICTFIVHTLYRKYMRECSQTNDDF